MPEVEEVPTLVSGEIKPADDAQTMLTNIEAYLKSIGATDEKSYVAPEEPKATIRELTAEEKAEYEAKKAESRSLVSGWVSADSQTRSSTAAAELVGAGTSSVRSERTGSQLVRPSVQTSASGSSVCSASAAISAGSPP